MFWKEQPKTPVSGAFRSAWSGGDFLIIDNATDTVVMRVNSKDLSVSARLPVGGIGTADIADQAVTMSKLEGSRLEAGTTLTELYKIQEVSAGSVSNASNESTTIVGVNYETVGSTNDVAIRSGIVNVRVAEALGADAPLKVAFDGEAGLWRSALKELEAAATATITSFTQPAGAVLEVVQLTGDVAAMRGKVIRIVGADGIGDVIWEDIALDDTDTTTPTVGTETFQTVSAAYVLDGSNVDTNDVRVRIESAGATVVDIAATANHTGAIVPTDEDPHFSMVDLVASAQDNTFVTVFGLDPVGNLTGERMELDNAITNSESVGTVVFSEVLRICTGEFTDGETVAVNARANTNEQQIGRLIEAAATLGRAYIKPNY